MNKILADNNSLDEFYLELIASLLISISSKSTLWFPASAVRKTLRIIRSRVHAEGIAFLTKAMPRLGKSLDQALSGKTRLDCGRWHRCPGTELPLFLGEFFQRVFQSDGWIKPDPCVDSIKNLRCVLTLLYKLELQHEKRTNKKLVEAYKATDESLIEPIGPQPEVEGRVFGGVSFRDPAKTQSCDPVWDHYKAKSGNSVNAIARVSRAGSILGRYLEGMAYICWPMGFPDLRTTKRTVRGLCSVSSCDGLYNGFRKWKHIYEHPSRVDVRGRNNAIADRSEPCRENESSAYSDPQQPRPYCGKANGKGCQSWPEPSGSGQRQCSGTAGVRQNGSSGTERPEVSTYVSSRVGSDIGVPGLSFNLGVKHLVSVARANVARLLGNCDLTRIVPRHGPGAVSTGERLYGKFFFKRLYKSLQEVYPYDAHFCVHPFEDPDAMRLHLNSLDELDSGTAKLAIVPKDSRGGRVICCEPLEIQAIQQGIMSILVKHVEENNLTRGYVNFADQGINQRLALEGSDGSLATLDLKEASDRVSLDLVSELFPRHIVQCLLAARSSHVRLPETILGRKAVIKLRKFASMGSSNCFPVMALTIWSVATSMLMAKYHFRNPERVCGLVYVYGDDVIVRSQDATDTMAALEAVDLKVNSAKSFTHSRFTESCGIDAFDGVDVTGLKIRTLWSLRPSPAAYESYISYSNWCYDAGLYSCAMFIAAKLEALYGAIPSEVADLEVWREYAPSYPTLKHSLGLTKQPGSRFNRHLQRREYRVLVSKPKSIRLRQLSWCEYLRWHWDAASRDSSLREYVILNGQFGSWLPKGNPGIPLIEVKEGVRAGQYQDTRVSSLTREWR